METPTYIVNLIAVAAVGMLASGTPASASTEAKTQTRDRTYANPIDLPYRYQPGFNYAGRTGKPYREAADPTVVRFKGEYWLFASHSLGYWRSTDLQHWIFVKASGYAVEKFAPTAVVIGGRMYLAVSESVKQIWVSDDPGGGKWEVAADLPQGFEDPCLFLDDDGRLYMYDGLSPDQPLHAAELDPRTFQIIRSVPIPASRDKQNRGWEVPGDSNQLTKDASYIEGSWMTKHAGRYYLEYSAPGTHYKSYANGVLTAETPMGPFTYEPYSPFAFKPTGFAGGAGHGSTFVGPDKRWWHFGTLSISRRHPFERRLAMFPTHFTSSGEVMVDTYLGDYPHYFDGNRGLTGWMLLSRGKKATASSALEGFAPAKAADEDIRTWWSANTGDAGEWYQLDLGNRKTIQALQVNFADQDSAIIGASSDGYRYSIEGSIDGRTWQVMVAEKATGRDAPNAYHVLPRAVPARYVRIRNLHSPDGAKFSLSDLRVFGNAAVPLPAKVSSLSAQRDAADPRHARIEWQPVVGADFYIVRLGTREDLMNQNFQVYDKATAVDVRSLNRGTSYVFQVDAANERGISRGTVTGAVP